jgi:hypothetical protein
MTYKTLGIFALAGAVAWTGATLFYAAFGTAMIEKAFWFYVINAVLTGVLLTVLFSGLTKATRVRRHEYLAPALAFATPSVLLSIAFAPGALRFFANAAPETMGRYGAYLFFAYMLVLAAAVTPRPSLQRA